MENNFNELLQFINQSGELSPDHKNRFSGQLESVAIELLEKDRRLQLEKSFDKVRARALNMKSSQDLSDVVATIFGEFDKLDLKMIRCGIGIINIQTRMIEVWTTTVSETGEPVPVSGIESADIHPMLQAATESWVNKKDVFTYLLEGEDLRKYYLALTGADFKLPSNQSHIHDVGQIRQYYYVFPFSAGGFFSFSEQPISEEAADIMKKFAELIDLAYTRFSDLKQAEMSLEAVRMEEQKLREEKKRSDKLLLNILPEEIAGELKKFGKSYARKHDQVSILFADIKDFSSISENLTADELVTQLDECYRGFDKILDKHNLEKIKTVGDAYICACGLPHPDSHHAEKTVQVALDMIEFLKGFAISKKILSLPAFEFRIGIHSGPVITGVVGQKKFTYDIWGDAVNTAARMEQHGVAGKINISESTYSLIKDKFACVPRGKIEAKNKGFIDMYFVEGKV